MSQKGKYCSFENYEDKDVYFNDQYCGELGENIRCYYEKGNTYKCTSQNGKIVCHPVGLPEHPIEGKCVISSIEPTDEPPKA